jgi:NADPH:quinone reductase-like Zn-dependent oxidoreductase
MRAWHFTLPLSKPGGLENNLVLNPSAPLPPHTAKDLGKDKILVKIAAAGLNPVDYKFAQISFLARFFLKTPSSPGLDFAGKVVAVGSNVASSGISIGQEVFGRLDAPTQFGSLAEYLVTPRNNVTVVPEGMDVKNFAGGATAGLTAYQEIVPNVSRDGGSRVLVNGGSGGVGLFCIQIAKTLGCHVTATCSGRNVELCKKYGADEVIDYTRGDIIEALKTKAADKKFDLVADNVGHQANLYWNAHHYTVPGAKYVQVGGDISMSAVYDMMSKALWPGFLGGGKRPWQFLGVSSKRNEIEELAGWMKESKVKVVIDEVFKFEDAPKAFEKLKKGRTVGKILVEVSDE